MLKYFNRLSRLHIHTQYAHCGEACRKILGSWCCPLVCSPAPAAGISQPSLGVAVPMFPAGPLCTLVITLMLGPSKLILKSLGVLAMSLDVHQPVIGATLEMFRFLGSSTSFTPAFLPWSPRPDCNCALPSETSGTTFCAVTSKVGCPSEHWQFEMSAAVSDGSTALETARLPSLTMVLVFPAKVSSGLLQRESSVEELLSYAQKLSLNWAAHSF